jgi:ABC-type dipeptide/oligopeptide/nickel transport system ATPase component
MNDVPLLEVAELSVEFRTRLGTVKALEQVDLSLDRGEIIAVVGESGSGKSVTAYSIMGILDALTPIPGGLPDLRGELPPCRYRGRCERYTLICDQAPLPRVQVDPRHVVACRDPL